MKDLSHLFEKERLFVQNRLRSYVNRHNSPSAKLVNYNTLLSAGRLFAAAPRSIDGSSAPAEIIPFLETLSYTRDGIENGSCILSKGGGPLVRISESDLYYGSSVVSFHDAQDGFSNCMMPDLRMAVNSFLTTGIDAQTAALLIDEIVCFRQYVAKQYEEMVKEMKTRRKCRDITRASYEAVLEQILAVERGLSYRLELTYMNTAHVEIGVDDRQELTADFNSEEFSPESVAALGDYAVKVRELCAEAPCGATITPRIDF